ncbi:hypothetical protein TNCV_4350051 [Trichonephila clavipes]|nr:hypothetical protein TNCV_4350051 [Trichonephila clavipes]
MKYYRKLISSDFDICEKIVKESEDFEGKDSGWTLNEISSKQTVILHSEVHHPSLKCRSRSLKLRQSSMSSIKRTLAFMWSILAALPQHQQPQENVKLYPPPKKLNFVGISFPTHLNEVEKFSKMNDIGKKFILLKKI